VNKHFQLRTCSDRVLESRTRPCLEYYIKRCPAPCVLEVDREEYGRQVRWVSMLLGGRQDELVRRLREEMQTASKALEFERAATLRDQLAAVESTLESQRVVSLEQKDMDVIAIYREADLAEIEVLFIRGGKFVEERAFFWRDVEFPDEEVVSSFATQFYLGGSFVPEIVLLGVGVARRTGAPSSRCSRTSRADRGGRGTAPRQANGARAAREGQREARVRAARPQGRRHGGAARGAAAKAAAAARSAPDRVHRHQSPRRHPDRRVARCAHRRPARQERHAHVSPARVSGGDDYAAMREIVTRRFQRAKADEPGWSSPDLLVIDGGRGQLAMAVEALREIGVTDQPVCALAKEREVLPLRPPPDALANLWRAPPGPLWNKRTQSRPRRRHPRTPRSRRGATSSWTASTCPARRTRSPCARAPRALPARPRQRRGAPRGPRLPGQGPPQERLRSTLHDVPGVGEKTAKMLLRKLGSLKAVRDATVEELAAVEGVSRRQAEAVFAHFRTTDERVNGARNRPVSSCRA